MLSHSRFYGCAKFFLFIGFLVCAGLLFCIFAVRGFINSLQTLRNTHRQGNRSDRRTKVRRGAVDAVSKNAFAQPFFTAVRNSFTYMIFYYSPHYFIRIFAVRGFINCLSAIHLHDAPVLYYFVISDGVTKFIIALSDSFFIMYDKPLLIASISLERLIKFV